jgi:hypothetical protein
LQSGGWPSFRPRHKIRITGNALPAHTLEGVEAALDLFDEVAAVEDIGRLRYALMVFLTHHPVVAELGLRLPSLDQP